MSPAPFQGPADLARKITEVWHILPGTRIPEKWIAQAAECESGFARLVDLAYHASFQKDEGRYVRVRLFLKEPYVGELPPTVMPFAEPVRLAGTDVIRRLAPTLLLSRHALLVDVRGDGDPACEGIIDVGPRESGGHVGDSLRNGWLGFKGIMVRVDAPGKIRVTAWPTCFELQAGRISRTRTFLDVPIVEHWLTKLSRALEVRCAECAATMGDEARAVEESEVRAPSRHLPHPMVAVAVSRVLLSAESLHHGGALVVLPTPGQEVPAEIELPYRVEEFSLADKLLAFWLSCIKARLARDRTSFDVASREWASSKDGLQLAADALGQLTAADGCVVIDANLRLYGFGGKIQVDDPALEASPRAFVDADSNEPIPEATLARFGTRHGSAFRLCKAVAGAMVFVLSQDGDLRIFASDCSHVYLAESLSPALLQHDQW